VSIIDFILGRPLKSSEGKGERVGAGAAIPLFGLDALSSAAYGPEAALTLLIPLGAAGLVYILPITLSIILLLSIVYFSYRQTIEAYPTGGGSYTVARHNLGTFAGLLAAAALMIDYTLNVAVGISAGVGALTSAIPSLQPHTLTLCLAILLVITIINLRGVRSAGLAFMAPTYLFVCCMFGLLVMGLVKTAFSGGHPHPVVAPHALPPATAAVSAWLIVKAFSSGCTALTGVEAVSNGVRAFQQPVIQRAQRTLTAIIGLLILLLAGIAVLSHAYGVGAVNPGSGYESVLSQLTGAIAGKGPFYYVTMASILLILSLSANTSFSDFPRVCRAVAQDGYLPLPFASRGRRLVYTWGIAVLALLSAFLLIVFDGVTDRLIPLFAVGAFTAFTLSQSGMVVHWLRNKSPKSRRYMAVNGLGATATAVTVGAVTISKFAAGAWLTVLLIPSMIVLMYSVHKHYGRVARETASPGPLSLEGWGRPVVVVPIAAWNRVSKKGLSFAMQLSPDVHVVYVDCSEGRADFVKRWDELVKPAAEEAKIPIPQLVFLKSPYRFFLQPILEYVLKLQRKNADRHVVVLIPELVEPRWYQYVLHNQRAQWLKAMLLVKGNQRIIVINVPWYLKEPG
jgi:amino acid transporter